MCRGTGEGKRRCPCDTSEKRRLRRKNSQAAQSVSVEALSPQRPAQAPLIEHTVSPEDIHQQVSRVQSLQDKASRPTPGGNKRIMEQLETETTYTGALFNKFLEQETGRSDKGIQDSWEQENRSLEESLSQADTEEEKQALRSRLKERSTDQGAETRATARERGNETLQVLQQFRSYGEGEFPLTDKESFTSQAHASVSRFLPSDWIQKAQDNGTQVELSLREGTGGKYMDTKPGEVSTIEIGSDYAYGAQLDSEPYLQSYARDNLDGLLIHETTHHMEYLAHKDDKNSLAQLQGAFLSRRTTHNGKREDPVSHDKLGYTTAKDMTVYADGFSNVYTGRVYPGGKSYEVLTTGAESVFTGKQGGLLGIGNCAPDPDHKNFVLGVWLTHRRT